MRIVDTARQIVNKSRKDIETPEYWGSVYKKNKQKRSVQAYNWLRWANYVDDDLWRGTLLHDMTEPMEINELKSCIFSIIPYILLEPAEINIRAYGQADGQAAMFWEQIAKFLDRQYYMYEEFIRAAYDALLYGNGVFKFGYWHDRLLSRPVWTSGLGVPFGAERAAFSRHMSLYELYPDRRAKRWDEQTHLQHVVPIHIEDILDNDVYDNKVARQIAPSMADDIIYSYEKLTEDTGQPEHAPVCEVHDFKNHKLRMFVLEQESAGWLYNGPLAYNMSCFENLQFFPRPLSIWGDSISQMVEKHQKRLSEAMTYESRAIAREGIAKIFYDLAMIGDKEMNKLRSNKDEFIGVHSPTAGLESGIHVVDYRTAGKDYNFQMHINKLQEIIRMQTGVTQQEMGIHESGVETKYEASMLKAASSVRNLLRRRMFSLFAERSFYKMLYMVSLEYTPQRLCQMAGLDPYVHAPQVRSFLPFDSRKFLVEYGNSAVDARQERLTKLNMFIQLLGPYSQYINPAVWMRIVTKELDFDFDTEMLIYNVIGQGAQPAGQLGNLPSVSNAATSASQSRVAPSGSAPAPQMGLGM